MNVTIRVCAWYDREHPAASLSEIRSLGFDGIDVDLGEFAGALGEGKPPLHTLSVPEYLEYFRPLREAAAGMQVPVRVMHAPVGVGSLEEGDGSAALLALENSFAAAEAFGCPAIVVHPAFRATREEEIRDNLAFYRRLFPLLRKYPGVRVCMENLFLRKLSRIFGMKISAADFAAMIDRLNEELGDQRFGFCFDTGHAILSGIHVRDYLLTLGHRVITLHIHDNNTVEDLHYMPYSCLYRYNTPYLDWQEFAETLRDIGYRGAINFETTRTPVMFPKSVRKEALRLTAALGRYWAGIVEGAPAGAPAAPLAPQPVTARSAIQSHPWYRHEDVLGSLQWIREQGFGAIDYSADTLIPAGQMFKTGEILPSVFDLPLPEFLDSFAPLKAASDTTGVAVRQMHAPFPLWDPAKPAVTEHLRGVMDKTFALAEYLGCPAVVIHPAVRADREEEWNENLALCRSLIPLIRKYKGVKICLENLVRQQYSRFFECALSAQDFAALIDQLNGEAGGDCFGFCFDVGHAILAKKNEKVYIKTLGHRLTALHLNENNGEDDLHHLPYASLYRPLSPFADWNGVLAALRDVGYEGALAFETLHDFRAFPQAVHPEMVQLLSAIGRHFADTLGG